MSWKNAMPGEEGAIHSDDPKYYNEKQVRAMLGVGRSTVFKLLREGKLERTKFEGATRISRASLRAYIASSASKTGASDV